ncbi:MAG: anthranilate synthase component I [Chloroflexota bacterium]
MNLTPTLTEVRALASEGHPSVMLSCEILADLETPVSAFLKLRRRGPAFLLESVEGGENLARYSVLASEPRGHLRIHRDAATLERDGKTESLSFTDPLELIDSLVRVPGIMPVKGLPRFLGGGVGYLSYECATYFERLPTASSDPLNLPLGQLLLVDTLVVFDHLRRMIKVLTLLELKGDPGNAYQEAASRLNDVVNRLQAPLQPMPLELRMDATPADLDVQSNFSQTEFENRVRRAKEYIAAGDVIQVVPSQRLTVPCAADPFAVYRALRVLNPSPYMYFLDFGDMQIVGASPELLVLVEDGRIVTHPIAGTRPRGATPDEDDGLAVELAENEKERAEHVMLVDLGRNDLGRVSKPGTVRVTRLMEIERYSHVMHLVSNVEGHLRDDLRPIDALRSCFPAGTVSGAPKIRAMEIIAELEQDQRGAYAGATGFFGFNGDLEVAITIRTMVIKDGFAHVQAGGGIVADSDPTAEFEETLHKARAALSAVAAVTPDRARERVAESIAVRERVSTGGPGGLRP